MPCDIAPQIYANVGIGQGKLAAMRLFITTALVLTSSMASAAKWEYASLLIYSGGSTLHVPGMTINGKDNTDLMTKLKCPKPTTLTHAVINCLGSQGWELVALDKGDMGGSDLTNWVFKRPGK